MVILNVLVSICFELYCIIVGGVSDLSTPFIWMRIVKIRKWNELLKHLLFRLCMWELLLWMCHILYWVYIYPNLPDNYTKRETAGLSVNEDVLRSVCDIIQQHNLLLVSVRDTSCTCKLNHSLTNHTSPVSSAVWVTLKIKFFW